MIYRGNLIIYDETGRILIETGQASGMEGSLLDHVLPVGVPYMIIPYGEIDYYNFTITGIDVTTENHKPILTPVIREKSLEEKLAEAEAKLKEAGLL